jgi:hypothetical protein
MLLTKLSLPGNNLIIPSQGEFGQGDIPVGDGKIENLFLQCRGLNTFLRRRKID